MGIVIGVSLVVYLFLSLPFCQKWMAGKIASVLAEQLQSRVEIGRAQVGLGGHAIIDDIHLWDRQSRPMLIVTRAGAKIDLFHLIKDGDVIINSAQLYGATAHLIKERPDTAFNFQFVIDAFKKKKNEPRKPLPHIEIRSIQVRHTNVTLDLNWKKRKSEGIFDPFHLQVGELAVGASINLLMDDTCNVSVQRLSLAEANGLQIKEGHLDLTRGKRSGIKVSGLHLALPGSQLDTPFLHFSQDKTLTGTIAAHIDPADVSVVYAPLKRLNDTFDLSLIASGSREGATISKFDISDGKGIVSLSANAVIRRTKSKIPDFDVNINQLSLTGDIEQLITPFHSLNSKPQQLLAKIGKTRITGNFHNHSENYRAEVAMNGKLGKAKASGTYQKGSIKAKADVENFNAGAIWNALRDSSNLFGTVTATVDVAAKFSGSSTKKEYRAARYSSTPQRGTRVLRSGVLEGHAKAVIHQATVKGYTYHNILAEVSHAGSRFEAKINSSDPLANVDGEFHLSTATKNPFARGLIEINNLDLASLHLSKSKRIHRIRTTVGINLEGNRFDNMAGDISIPHIIITNSDTTCTLTGMQLISSPVDKERHVTFTSPYLTMQADGTFAFRDLKSNFQKLMHVWMPDFFKSPARNATAADMQIRAQLIDPTPLRVLLGADLALQQGPLDISLDMNSDDKTLQAKVNTPHIRYGSQELEDISLKLDSKGQDVAATVHLQRMMKGNPVDLDLGITTRENNVAASAKWKVGTQKQNDGEIALHGTIERQTQGGLSMVAHVKPTTVHVNDTLWNIAPSQLYYRNKELYVDNFSLAMNGGNRGLTINGSASRNDEDSLIVHLQDFDMDYIFNIAQLKPLTMGGYATGDIVARHVFRSPVAEANVDISDFTFNHAPMGQMQAYMAWGIKPGTLDLKGLVTDAAAGERMTVDGSLHLLKDPIQHMDMRLDFTRANLAFMNRYVASIMKDFTGRASGNLRIFGNFGFIDMEGDIFAHECAITVPSLNVRYHTVNQSLHLTPGCVAIDHVRAYDRDGSPEKPDHSATITGKIQFEHFRNMHYTFDIEGQNVLAYDTHQFGDFPFYCTAIGTGDVHLNGGPGFVNIDINATPTRGTVLTYNASNPNTLTQAGFITYVDRSQQLREEEERKKQKAQEEAEKKQTTDMHINFNINLTPEAKLRMLMDPRSGDYITVYGTTHMLATYYNKGRFQMFGTYRVDHGTYNLTLQEVIHKDFQIKEGSTLVFGGAPFEGDLNIQAIYTVPSVSLNDLSVKGTFSNSTVRVNCLMNITGKARSPRVSFDFDIPNVNEDEARMVRALISTDEERNMQVIYLLGIGRFYTYDNAAASQTQSATAVNSLLSSTLSGQLNQMLSNMIGRESNWNLGANLSTGTMGWSDMDVEGMLSGRLLNNRLLINGNFGYRDNPVAQSNFIGDFDVQYLLTKSGNLVLKAYSETNDRYFTKSSLTTQGVGLLVKRDFTSWRDFFRTSRKRENKQQKQSKQKGNQAIPVEQDSLKSKNNL